MCTSKSLIDLPEEFSFPHPAHCLLLDWQLINCSDILPQPDLIRIRILLSHVSRRSGTRLGKTTNAKLISFKFQGPAASRNEHR